MNSSGNQKRKKGRENNFSCELNNDISSRVNNTTKFSVKASLLRKAVENVLQKEGADGKEVSIALVEKEKMKEMSRIYRNKDSVTDVLSFFYNEENFLGEIVLCPEKIKENSGKKNFTKEICRVTIHGTLHLLRYSHEEEKQEKLMKEKTEKYLKEVLE